MKAKDIRSLKDIRRQKRLNLLGWMFAVALILFGFLFGWFLAGSVDKGECPIDPCILYRM